VRRYWSALLVCAQKMPLAILDQGGAQGGPLLVHDTLLWREEWAPIVVGLAAKRLYSSGLSVAAERHHAKPPIAQGKNSAVADGSEGGRGMAARRPTGC